MTTERAVFERANEHMRTGTPELAAAACLEGLKQFPDDPNLLCLAGRSLIALHRLDEARTHIEKARNLHPASPITQEVFGDLMLVEGLLDTAIAAYQQAIELNPGRSELHLKIGRARDQVKEHGQTERPRRQQMAFQEEMAEAEQHESNGAPNKAEKIYRNILRRDPEHVEAMRLLAAVAVKHRKFRDAEVFLSRAVECAPHYARAWLDLATVQMEQEKLADAIHSAQQLVDLTPDLAESHITLANAQAKASEMERAMDSYRAALKIAPKHAGALSGLGQQLKTLGQQAEAVAVHRENISRNPKNTEPYWSLANMKTFRFEEQEVTTMEALLEDKDLDDLPAEQLCNSLGLEYEQRKDYPRAFSYFQRCNTKRRQREKYDPVETEVTTEALIDIFSADLLQANQGSGVADASPIFIIGLPRSGSTLIEQILASHSQVEGTHELTDLDRVVNAIPKKRAKRDRFPHTVTHLGSRAWSKLGNQYLERTQKYRSGLPRFIDKNPNNFIYAGLLQLALPNAKIIDARRTPLDSCFGSYKQLFASGQPFTYDLTEIGEYYLQYDRLMQHWESVIPGHVLRVNYEEVVDDLETQVRRLLDYCDLPFEEACLDFHATDRAVKTASSEQVRQPIYASSLNLWRNYEADLGELIEVLEPLLLNLPPEQRPQKYQ